LKVSFWKLPTGVYRLGGSDFDRRQSRWRRHRHGRQHRDRHARDTLTLEASILDPLEGTGISSGNVVLSRLTANDTLEGSAGSTGTAER
jgi:hypothetical protein